MTINEAKRKMKEGFFLIITDNQNYKIFGTLRSFLNVMTSKIDPTKMNISLNEILELESVIYYLRQENEIRLKVLKVLQEKVSDSRKIEQIEKQSEPIEFKFDISKDKMILISVDELKEDALKFCSDNKVELLDEWGGIFAFVLEKFGYSTPKLSKDEEEEKKKLEKKLEELKESQIINPSLLLIHFALTHKKIRHKVQSDGLKLAVSGRNAKKNQYTTEIRLLENGSTIETNYYLSEEQKRPLNLYHFTALFDLIIRLIRMGKIKENFIMGKGRVCFIVAKGNEKIYDSKGIPVITNQTIKEMVGVSDLEASRIKQAILELTELVIVHKLKNGTNIGFYPIRKIGFIEDPKANKRFDLLEIDMIFIKNGKKFIPMIPNTYSRIMKLDAPERTKQTTANIFNYLLIYNRDSKISYISPKSYSKVFPNSYANKRRWGELKRIIRRSLTLLEDARLINDFKEEKGHFVVKLRN
jgi:hypothetical protein